MHVFFCIVNSVTDKQTIYIFLSIDRLPQSDLNSHPSDSKESIKANVLQ